MHGGSLYELGLNEEGGGIRHMWWWWIKYGFLSNDLAAKFCVMVVDGRVCVMIIHAWYMMIIIYDDDHGMPYVASEPL